MAFISLICRPQTTGPKKVEESFISYPTVPTFKPASYGDGFLNNIHRRVSWENIGKDWSYITTKQGKLEATGR